MAIVHVHVLKVAKGSALGIRLRNDDTIWTLHFKLILTETSGFDSPSDGFNEKDSYTYFKAQGFTKGLRNKEVRTFELNKGPSPTFHIRCAV